MVITVFLLAVLVMWLIGIKIYRHYTPIVIDMRELGTSDTTYKQWNQEVFNPALRKAFYRNRKLYIVRFPEDTVYRGAPNDKFEIDEHSLALLRPLPAVVFDRG